MYLVLDVTTTDPGASVLMLLEPSKIWKLLRLQQLFISKITLLLYSVTSNMLGYS